jgi:DNA-directed RNA polymerase
VLWTDVAARISLGPRAADNLSRPLNTANALVQSDQQRLAVTVCCLSMDEWEPKSRATMRRAAEWQLEGVKLRAIAMHVSDLLTREQLLMLAVDCEDEAMREAKQAFQLARSIRDKDAIAKLEAQAEEIERVEAEQR